MLKEPLTQVSWNLKVDPKKKEVSYENLLLNGKPLKEIFCATYDLDRINEVTGATKSSG